MTAVPPVLPENPYVGLTPFDEADAQFFFGRERERRIIAANLRASRLTLVYGPTGVGKTSLLRAGVAHDLRVAAERDVAEGRLPDSIVVVFRSWHDDPVLALGSELAATVSAVLGDLAPEAALPQPSLEAVFDEWRHRLDGRADGLQRLTGLRQRPSDLLVVLDQFEEYFLYHGDDRAGAAFAHEFARVVNRRELRANFIVSIREEAYTLLDRFESEIPNVFGNNLRIEHLDRDGAAAAILGPVHRYAELAGDGGPVDVEPELVDRVIEQVSAGSFTYVGGVGAAPADRGHRVETPFLQLVMQRLWDDARRQGSRFLQRAALERLGGAQRIVGAHLGDAIASLDAFEQDVAERLFARLVTPSGMKIAYVASDLAAYEELELARVAAVLEQLASARIVRAVAPPPGEAAPRFELFHDVLIPAVLAWRTEHAQRRRLNEANALRLRDRRRVRAYQTLAVVLLLQLVVIVVLTVAARR